jgi:hypothetical protein
VNQASAKTESDFSIEKYGERTAEKVECDQQLLAEYAALLGFYIASVAVLTGAALEHDRLPKRFSLLDLVLLGIATHKLSRIIAKDRITGILRAPFVNYIRSAGAGEGGGRTARAWNAARNRDANFMSLLHGAVVRDSARVRANLCAACDAVFRWDFSRRNGVGFSSACLSRG